MRSDHPTVVATFTSSTTVTLQAPSASPPFFTNAGARDIHLTGTAGGNTGDINIAVGPTYGADKRIAGPGGAIYPGFVFPPDVKLDEVSIGVTKSGSTQVMPFGAYTASLPGAVTQTTDDAFIPWTTSSGVCDGQSDIPFRMLGVRSVLTVNSSLLESYGQVYVSDNGTLLPDEPAANLYIDNSYSKDMIQRSDQFEDQAAYTMNYSHGEFPNRS